MTSVRRAIILLIIKTLTYKPLIFKPWHLNPWYLDLGIWTLEMDSDMTLIWILQFKTWATIWYLPSHEGNMAVSLMHLWHDSCVSEWFLTPSLICICYYYMHAMKTIICFGGVWMHPRSVLFSMDFNMIWYDMILTGVCAWVQSMSFTLWEVSPPSPPLWLLWFDLSGLRYWIWNLTWPKMNLNLIWTWTWIGLGFGIGLDLNLN